MNRPLLPRVRSFCAAACFCLGLLGGTPTALGQSDGAAAVVTHDTARGTGESPAPRPESPPPRHFVLVAKTHFDIGYSALARDVEHEYRTTMIDRALETIEQNARVAGPEEPFVWTIPGWPMETILWDGQHPARRQRIEAALTRGQEAAEPEAFERFALVGGVPRCWEFVKSKSLSVTQRQRIERALPD